MKAVVRLAVVAGAVVALGACRHNPPPPPPVTTVPTTTLPTPATCPPNTGTTLPPYPPQAC